MVAIHAQRPAVNSRVGLAPRDRLIHVTTVRHSYSPGAAGTAYARNVSQNISDDEDVSCSSHRLDCDPNNDVTTRSIDINSADDVRTSSSCFLGGVTPNENASCASQPSTLRLRNTPVYEGSPTRSQSGMKNASFNNSKLNKKMNDERDTLAEAILEATNSVHARWRKSAEAAMCGTADIYTNLMAKLKREKNEEECMIKFPFKEDGGDEYCLCTKACRCLTGQCNCTPLCTCPNVCSCPETCSCPTLCSCPAETCNCPQSCVCPDTCTCPKVCTCPQRPSTAQAAMFQKPRDPDAYLEVTVEVERFLGMETSACDDEVVCTAADTDWQYPGEVTAGTASLMRTGCPGLVCKCGDCELTPDGRLLRGGATNDQEDYTYPDDPTQLVV